ncbi:MAG: RNA methyltransferase [Simkaniaceae bacterium]|nr:RNA methyltransferase [Simkaniaceae bacterium]
MDRIESLQNPRVKQLVKLQGRRERDKTQLFLIEGYREISRGIDASFQTLFYSKEHFLGSNESMLIAQAKDLGVEVVEVSKAVFNKISYRDRPDGLLAVAQQKHLALSELKLSQNPFIVIAEGIEKPGNLGSILRSSDAAGVDALIICDRCTDIHNPNVVRASVGTLFTVPVIEASSKELLHFLKKHRILTLAATPSAEKEYTAVDLKEPVAIAVGCEQLGLSKLWLDETDIQVKIPMHGASDSLNVAAATTILLYEVRRQRK